MKKIIFILLILILFSCGKQETDVLKRAKKIKFDKWNETIIPKGSILIAEDKISNIQKGLFRTHIDFEVLKSAYILNNYKDDSSAGKNFKLLKDNIVIRFIIVDDENINIMIDITR